MRPKAQGKPDSAERRASPSCAAGRESTRASTTDSVSPVPDLTVDGFMCLYFSLGALSRQVMPPRFITQPGIDAGGSLSGTGLATRLT